MIRAVECVGVLAACLAVYGCGTKENANAVKRYPVSGTATFDNQPLADGQIYFKTVATGSLDIVPIKDGKFKGDVEAGNRRVEISAYREGKPSEAAVKMYGDKAAQMAGNTKENYIPAKYNTGSKLTAEVKTSGPNEFKFDLTSK
ncbi:MAG: hypothetical protein ACLQNE_13520 [Thermoguttaceae bacterium]|jgi:hypothetical protein